MQVPPRNFCLKERRKAMIFIKQMDSLLGKLVLCQHDEALCALHFGEEASLEYAGEVRDTPLLQRTQRQLTEYFVGERRAFDIPLVMEGTSFQLCVWQALREIPYGEVRTYGEIARRMGRPQACRAVGMANHVNPIAVIVPCHRVIGANGRLTGYAGGLDIKERLLRLENRGMLPYIKLTTGAAK